MPPLSFPSSAVPIVGAPFEVFEFVPVVTMRCACAPGNKPVTLCGTTATARCAACSKTYIIGSVSYDRQESRVHVSIGTAMPGVGNGHKPRD